MTRRAIIDELAKAGAAEAAAVNAREKLRALDAAAMATRLRDPRCEITREDRELLADYLDGRIKRGRGGQPAAETALRYQSMARHVRIAMRHGVQREEAVLLVRDLFDVSKRTVETALSFTEAE